MTPLWNDVRPKGYYVYIHRRADNGKPFYVGKGVDARAWVYYGRMNKRWDRTAAKHGVYVSIILDGLTEKEALALEVDVIDEIGIDNLVNMTIGGEGVSGLVHSDDTRMKMSASRKGKSKSRDHAKAVALAKTGKYRTEEQKRAMSIAKGGGTIYTFQSSCGDTVTSTIYDLSARYSLNRSKVWQVANGQRMTHKGWRLIK